MLPGHGLSGRLGDREDRRVGDLFLDADGEDPFLDPRRDPHLSDSVLSLYFAADHGGRGKVAHTCLAEGFHQGTIIEFPGDDRA